MNSLNKNFEIFEIIENATIIYTDDISEFFDAIRLTDKGIIIGRVLKIDNIEEFVDCGFIPHHNIKNIKNGFKREIYKRKS